MNRQFKTLPLFRLTVVFAGFLWGVTPAGPSGAQSPSSPKPDAGATAPADVHSAPNTPQKPSNPVVWHHFGESNTDRGVVWRHYGESDPARGGAQSQQGMWHRFGPNPSPTQVGPSKTPRLGQDRIASLERQMWELVNRDRLNPEFSAETHGQAQPVRWNEQLAAVARAHSRDMIEQGYYDHVDPEGRGPSARLNAAGIPWQSLAENIAIHPSIASAEFAFMDEPPFQHNHRGNILNAKYTDVGIGIVQGPDGNLYITQDFIATPESAPAKGSETARLTPRP
jgi:uncharacterized protein YkwD